MRQNIAWEGKPPPSGRLLKIVSPRPQQPAIEAVVLSSHVYGVWTHFDEMRTRPCFEMEMENRGQATKIPCPLCQAGHSRRWKGYLAGVLARSGLVVLVEITRMACEGCPRLWPGAETLRGCRIRLGRTGTRRNSRVHCTVEPCVDPASPDLPPNPDVDAALMRVWFGGPSE